MLEEAGGMLAQLFSQQQYLVIIQIMYSQAHFLFPLKKV